MDYRLKHVQGMSLCVLYGIWLKRGRNIILALCDNSNYYKDCGLAQLQNEMTLKYNKTP